MIILCTERLIELLREIPPEEPARKRYIQEMISWSGKFGPLERGDPELHHAAGSVYAEGTPCPKSQSTPEDLVLIEVNL